MILSTLLLRSSSPTGLLFWCCIGLCAGVYIFIQGFRLLQRRHLILDTPVSRIRSASLGLVELSGLAVGPFTLTAPVTARPSYYYRTLVWEWKQSGKNKRWVKVAAECMHVPFFLDDNTGKVMVDPRGADLDLHRDFQEEFCDSFFTTKEEPPPNVRELLSRHGISTSNKIKVEEFCIKPKNSLFILGTLDENTELELKPQPICDEEHDSLGNRLSFALGSSGRPLGEGVTDVLSGLSLTGGLQHDPAYDSIYRNALSSASAHVIRLSPEAAPTKAADMTHQQAIAAALMKAGIANPAAWSAAGVTPYAQASSSTNRAGVTTGATDGFDTRPPVVVKKGENNTAFLISWRSQRDVARSLGWKCALMIWGGPALALLSLYGLLNLTHLF